MKWGQECDELVGETTEKLSEKQRTRNLHKKPRKCSATVWNWNFFFRLVVCWVLYIMLCFSLCWIFIQHSQSVYTLLERRVVASEFMPKSHSKARVSLEDMQMKVLQIYLRFNYVLREHRFHFVDFEQCWECEKYSNPNIPTVFEWCWRENPIFICSTSSSSDGSELCGIFGKRLMCIFFEFNLCDWKWIDLHKEKRAHFQIIRREFARVKLFYVPIGKLCIIWGIYRCAPEEVFLFEP